MLLPRDLLRHLCSFLRYTEDVVHLRKTCRAIHSEKLYKYSGHVEPHGVHVEYGLSPACTIVSECKDGVKHGESVTINPRDHRVLDRFHYYDGLKHGWQIEYYHANGTPSLMQRFHFGTLIDVQVEWKENGQIDRIRLNSSNPQVIDRTYDGGGGWTVCHYSRTSLIHHVDRQYRFDETHRLVGEGYATPTRSHRQIMYYRYFYDDDDGAIYQQKCCEDFMDGGMCWHADMPAPMQRVSKHYMASKPTLEQLSQGMIRKP